MSAVPSLGLYNQLFSQWRFLCFAFFAPLAYGTPLSHQEFESRMWLHGWR